MALRNRRTHAAIVASAVAALAGLTPHAHAQTIQRLLGIDVSDWQDQNAQGPINWNLVRNPTGTNNVVPRQFAFIRSSRGGTVGFYDEHDADNSNGLNTGAQRYDDYAFEYNITQAKSVGMYAGPYHFARADILTYQWNGQTVTHTATDEANHFIQQAGPWMKPGYLLPVFDFEAGAAQRSTDNLTAFALEFAARIKAVKGIVPVIYSSSSYASEPADASNGFTGSGNNTGEIRPAVAQAMPNLWLARWPGQGTPGYNYLTVEAQVGTIDPTPAAGYPNAYGVWNPTYPNTPDPHPWKFWQYTSRGRVQGIGFGNVNVDLDVAHGGHEFMKDHLVPALWTKTLGGDWATISNWNTDADPSGRGPAARLPGGDDTVILDRANENIGVTINGAVPGIRKLYLKESLTINPGGSLAVTYVPSPDSTPMSVQLSQSLNIQDGASFSAHTVYVDPGAFIGIQASNLTLNTIRLSSGNVLNVIDAFNEAQSPTFAGFNGGTATITHNAAPGQTIPHVYLAGGGGGFNVIDGAADIDLAVNVPIVNFGGGPLAKYGAGTMALGAPTQGNSVVVQRGILLVTGNGQLGSGSVSTQQTVVTPGSSGYGGTLQLSGNVSYSQPLTIAGGGVNGVSATPNGLTGALDNRFGDNTWGGPITLAGTGSNGNDPLENQIGATSGTLRLSGVIQNAAGVAATWAKTGAGDVVLTGGSANTYTGLTRQFGGRLIVEKNEALGSAGFTFNATGNTFQLAGSASTLAFRAPSGSSGFTYSTFEVLNTHGTGAPGFGQVDNLGGDNTFAGQIAIGGPNFTGGGMPPSTQVGSIGVSEGSLTMTGGIFARATGPRVINKLGAGTLILAGAGGTGSGNGQVTPLTSSTFNVTAGTLALNGTSSNGANLPGVTTWNLAAGATLRLHQLGALGGGAVNVNNATIATAGNDAAVTGPIRGAGALTKAGAGTLRASSLKIGGPVAVNAGTLEIAADGGASGMFETSGLTVASGALLAMNDNDFLVNYGPTDPSPEFALRDLVKATIDGSASGISFTVGGGDVAFAVAEKTEWGFGTFNGVTLDDTTVIGKYTYYGDANLDGKVTSDDYVAVDVGLGAGDSWVQGDFNFSGTVTSDDYVAIDVNLGKGTPTPLAWAELKSEMVALHTEMFGAEYVEKLAQAEANGYGATLVPEPAGIAGLGFCAVAMTRRRRAPR